MSYDLLIKDGTIIDGSGRPPYKSDIGIRGGKIIDISRLDRGEARVIDAEGRYVTPGFIDLHTHYDTQVLWDPYLTSAPFHGVSTVVMGNCGLSMAPCNPQDQEYVMGMFATVEGVNYKSLELGTDWTWKTFPEYLDRVQKKGLAINSVNLVGHSALRRFVMGPAANERHATPEEIGRMKAVLREALAAGAWGYTTSFGRHTGMDGKPVPSRLASHEEAIEIASVLSEFRTGHIEIIPATHQFGPDGVMSVEDQNLLKSLSIMSGRPTIINEISQDWERPKAWKANLEWLAQAAAEGAQVFAMARTHRHDMIFNLTNAADVLRMPAWKNVLSKPKEQRVRELRDPLVRAVLKADVDRRDKDIHPYRRFPNLHLIHSKTGKYRDFEEKTMGEIGKILGKDPVDVLIDLSLEEDLELEAAIAGTRCGDINSIRESLKCDYTVPGVSDAGAHTDRDNGSAYSTYLLTHWVRDSGDLKIEDAVRRLSFLPASLVGLWDRGWLRPGLAADVVIFDLARLNGLHPERVNDLPGGAERLIGRAEGYEYLIVNGQVVYDHEKATGALPGRVLRSRDYRSNGS